MAEISQLLLASLAAAATAVSAAALPSKRQEGAKIYQEKSTTGLFGTWTRVGGAPNSQRIEFAHDFSNNEGGLLFRDNVDPGLYQCWIDQSTTEQYVPAQARTLNDMAAWKRVPLDNFPTNVKHGIVVPVNQAQYDLLLSVYQRKL
ncbi:hypothetical protein KVT40_003110 [Elsinoe batatas]|uniref:Uncharacterized protein n=1 Tax=Elsinoe batatas TaxID=2601811 RepID=A0A8K0L855_9PEZI|nr:hypothetical protein KVT40_003110 [Elsinoe batatas]